MEDHFAHVSDGDTSKLRQRFTILENAKTHAIVIAEDAQEDEWDGYWVVITDAHGAEIASVPWRAKALKKAKRAQNETTNC